MDASTLRAHLASLLEKARSPGAYQLEGAQEVLQGTLTVVSAVYGPKSDQTASVRAAGQRLRSNLEDTTNTDVVSILRGTLQNIQAEIDGGLLGSIEKRATGEVLADFVGLARFTLQERGANGKNVAAVLAAAAFEDTVRRMGVDFAGVIGRDDLQNVIQALKNAGILVSPQLAIAQSYLSFRNHALHAEWDKIDAAAVHSVLSFVEQLVIKHFG